MFQNLEISQKLYSLKSLLKDSEDILLINNLIEKYKTEINVDFEYSKLEIARMRAPIYKIYIEAGNYCWDVYGINTDENYNEQFEKELEELLNKFELIKFKIHKQTNASLRSSAKESLKIIIKEECIKLILKHYK